jgi:hypothetical protein
MIAMENATVIDGDVVADELILKTRDGTPINAGNVRGPVGPSGANGSGYIVCTSTTRPSLLPSDEGKAIYETDTDLVRTWTGTRWKLQEYIICTSTTRPAGLVAQDEGVKIYEVDTKKEFLWTGSDWQKYPSQISTGIIVSGPTLNGPTAGATLPLNRVVNGPASWLNSNVITIPVGAGGIYRISYDVAAVSGSAIMISAEIRNAANAAKGMNTTLGVAQNGTWTQHLHGMWVVPVADGDTFKIVAMNANQAQAVNNFSLIRESDSLGG